MSNGAEHLEVVKEMLKVIYDLGYEGHWKTLTQNGMEMEITLCYKKKPLPSTPPPEPFLLCDNCGDRVLPEINHNCHKYGGK